MSILDIKASNNVIIDLIHKNQPFTIVRLGIGSETYMTLEYVHTGKINKRYLHPELLTLYNAGIYTRDKDLKKMELYCKFYDMSIKNSDILASFVAPNMVQIQNYFSNKYSINQIHSRSLEPFYAMMDNEIPWTHHLKGKKVLVIHPFVKSFQKQLNNNFQMFKNTGIFLPDQEFVFYKTFQTIAGNHIHDSWVETFNIMCNDIKNLDFDIALLGCGGYGLPLCNYIKKSLKKSAIYIGGGLQLLFGVTGKRWDTNENIQKIIRENGCEFIRPSQDEQCDNLRTIEGGCYW